MTPPDPSPPHGGGASCPPHRSPVAVALVATGGLFGAAARDLVDQALPTPGDAFPSATLLINLIGALLLGLLLEALARTGDDTGVRRRVRLVLGTGFLGAFTTYSTFAVETDLLARGGRSGVAVAYVTATVLGGLAATAIGIVVAARGRGVAAMPVDPDLDRPA